MSPVSTSVKVLNWSGATENSPFMVITLFEAVHVPVVGVEVLTCNVQLIELDIPIF